MKKSYLNTPLVLVSFLSVISVSVASTELPIRGPIPFSVYDIDGNGVISEQEFTQIRNERIAAKTAQGRPMKNQGNSPSFVSFDEDGNGQLTQEELASGQQDQMQNRRNKGGQSLNNGQSRGKGVGMGKNSNMPSFSDFDLNDDGVILKEEFYEARAIRITKRVKQGYPMRNIANPPTFEDIDMNSDGGISSKEFSQHQVSHRKQMMQK